ncbi:YeiH family putative sulfate export transporter [Brenneria roseae subsp. americana]|uniref:YeiH family putative sulfate export transporter n=1 Tax=Brenneria roseae subsp. americana TaxID=1508507 RepID=A0A2U1TLS2_9GAMM|nr:YeiH family protein [Brenneria roseae]PWC10357.1 YeiH family putative sulfate export transporter [Brenneria roseae subsp. americana]
MIALSAVQQRIKPHYRVITLLPGLSAVSLMTLFILWLATIPQVSQWGPGSLTLAIVAGILLGNTLYPRLHTYCDLGVQWAKQHLLRWGIMLYGFRISFQQITTVGTAGIIIDLAIVASTFLLACWLGRRLFKLDSETTILIGAGSSICGAAAILATAPVVNASGDKIAVAVSTVVIFGTAAIFLYPWLYQLNLYYHWITLTPQTFGMYLGSTIHEVAQVVAAGHAINAETENIAVIGKMLRVMLLAPFLLALGLVLKNRQQTRSSAAPVSLMFPWFALWFVAIAAFNSCQLLSTDVVNELIKLDNILLMMAMIALGLTTRLSAIRQAGVKPLLLALILFLWLLAGGAGINLAVEQLFR